MSCTSSPGTSVTWRPLRVIAKPVVLGSERVGELEFRGGLELDSDDPAFGGISGLEVRDDGFLAVTDRGSWVTGRIVLDPDRSALNDVTDVSIAPMLDES